PRRRPPRGRGGAGARRGASAPAPARGAGRGAAARRRVVEDGFSEAAVSAAVSGLYRELLGS
ncbi:glycosyltransferase family 1 protein, partial [Methylobacterium sp. WL122]